MKNTTKLIILDTILMMVWVLSGKVTEHEALAFLNNDDTLNSVNDIAIHNQDPNVQHEPLACCCGDCTTQLLEKL